ncbi:hypothetical protein CMO88_04715 [Candidatus Woesearchaeota archaeon]|nr:hypothetical protein [Candidatus Woesearchaeota archaeon]|tara:strand:- start:8882 stop:9547 length:666 start_codon:yes stop_codon:yes gene_type:complete
MGIGDEVYRVVHELLQSYSTDFVNYLPNLTKGSLIIVIGYFVAQVFGFVVKKALYRLNLDKRLRKADLDDSFGKVSLAKLFGTLAKWFVFFVFFAEGISFLEIGFIKILSQELARWTFIITVNIILIVIGFVFIDFVLYKIWEIRTKYDSAIQISARMLLVLVIVFTTLDQQGINLSFLKNVLLLIFSAILLSVSLAVGIGLGIGFSKNVDKAFKLFKKKR